MAVLSVPLLRDAPTEPWALLRDWYAAAESARLPDYNAMTLATASAAGVPSARIVLLRGLDERGLVFYTNFRSRKARELADNPRAALVLHWPDFKRQIRVEGAVESVNADQADAYFRSRPRGHQLSALISPQSEVIADASDLEQAMAELQQRYPEGTDVPRPAHWGGYRVVPNTVEFWEHRDNRLHYRLRYRLDAAGQWQRERLAP